MDTHANSKHTTIKICKFAAGDKCDVCLSEKLAIIKDKDGRQLNKRHVAPKVGKQEEALMPEDV